MSDWSVVTAVALVLGVTVALLGWAFFSIGSVETHRVEWAVTSVAPETAFGPSSVSLPNLEVGITAVDDVDYFYKKEGEWGITGVSLALKTTGDSTVSLPVSDSYFIDSRGTERKTVIMEGYKDFSSTPKEISVGPGKEIKIVLVSSKAYLHNETLGWLVTLLAKNGEKASFVLPVTENGRTVFYRIDLGTVALKAE